jgi:hypothetical protein
VGVWEVGWVVAVEEEADVEKVEEVVEAGLAGQSTCIISRQVSGDCCSGRCMDTSWPYTEFRASTGGVHMHAVALCAHVLLLLCVHSLSAGILH